MKIEDTKDGETRSVEMRIGVQNIDGSHMETKERYEVPRYFAEQLVATNRAVFVDAVESGDPDVETRDPDVESRDPVAAKRGKK